MRILIPFPETLQLFKSRSSDGTQVAGACGNGHVIFAHVIEKRHRIYIRTVTHSTGMRFVSFLSGGFITIVVNPPERRLAKRASVYWFKPIKLELKMIISQYMKRLAIHFFCQVL